MKEYTQILKSATKEETLSSKEEGSNHKDVFLSPRETYSGLDLYDWLGVLIGPPDTPYEGGLFQVDIKVPLNYPLEPPKVKFLTKVFHPNVHFKTGEICLDLLKSAWSAVYSLESVCRAILSLLAQPEAESPLNCDCGNLLRCGDIRGYNSLAKMYTKLSAKKQNLSEEFRTLLEQYRR